MNECNSADLVWCRRGVSDGECRRYVSECVVQTYNVSA